MIGPAECAADIEADIEDADGEAPGLRCYPDDLPLPKRPGDCPPGFYLSPCQIEQIMTEEDPENWRLSAYQERGLRDMRLREAANTEAQHQAAIEKRRADKQAKRAAAWQREWDLRGLKMRRPDWFMPGLNAHNLALRRQKLELIKRCAGYLAELCRPNGFAGIPEHYRAAVVAVFGTEKPYKSPRKVRDLFDRVTALAREFIAARTAAMEAADTAAEIAPLEGGSPPPPHARLLKRNRGKSIQRTVATRLSESSGYSTARASAKPSVSIQSARAEDRETLPAPDAPGASKGPRNIAWLPARLVPHKIRGLAFASLDKLEFRHGRYGCTVEWNRGHAVNFLASGLAAGRPLAGLVAAYRDALGREDHGNHVPGRAKRSPGRVIARARRAAYRLGIIAPWALDAYREKRDGKREGRERCRAFESAAVARERDENARMIEAAKAAVNSPDFDERGRARRFLDGLGIAY